MKNRRWIAWAIAIIAYALVILSVVLVSHTVNRSLQLSPMDEFITTGISISAVTLGIVLGIRYYFAKRKG